MNSRPPSEPSSVQQTLIPLNKANNRVNVRKDPTMFDLDSMNQRAEDFSTSKPGEGECNSSLSVTSPGLLAIKNHANKINLTRPKIIHEKQQDVLNTVPTWIANKPQLPNLAPTNALKNELDDEKNRELATLNFGDDPIAYFFKHKDGSGHLFIYLDYAKPRGSLDFNPYDLVKVTHSDVSDDYFTMSSNGVTHLFNDGSSETTPLEAWIRETSIFNMLRKLTFFQKFYYWKSFKLWKKFIQNQRFCRFRDKIISNVWFHDHKFYNYLLDIMKETSDSIISQYLLCMISQKKYVLQEYLNDCKTNSEILSTKYSDFVRNVVEKLLQLDADIKDPQRVTVSSTEFQKNKNIIPNLGQLMVIQEKVLAEQARRVAVVNKELYEFGNFIRLIDYIMIEQLSSSCFKCWKEAEANIKQELSAVFTVSVFFDKEGKVKFTPSLDELKSAISETLHNTFKLIDSLPRIIKEQSLREHLRKTNGNLGYLYDNMPQFRMCTDSNPEYGKIEERILQHIETDYEDALLQSQKFVEFYELYKHGKIWTAENYFTPRGGQQRVFDFTPFASDFDNSENRLIFDPSQELVFDFNRILEDIHHFKEEEMRINQFRACAVRGAIFIDSKDLRAELAPIPSKSILAVQYALQKFIEEKIDKINKIFNFSNKRLKREPNSLVQYAENTEFLNLILEINPLLKAEINYIDDVYSLLDKIVTNFATSHIGEHTRNPLHSSYKVFQQVLQMGKNMIENSRHKYVDELTKRVGIQVNNINKFKSMLDNIPTELSKQEVNDGLKMILDLKSKIDNIQPEIDTLEHCQSVMKATIQDLREYDAVRLQCDFDIQVFNITNQWTVLSAEVLSQPFADINISEFSIQLNSINTAINSLKDSNPVENKLLMVVDGKVKQLMQYIDELDMLSNSKMHFHHWSKLFEDCGQSKGYHNQIRIDELISLGILDRRDKVEEITSLSLGESHLEAEFQELAAKWKEVRLPLLESQIKTEDSLLLGDLKELYVEIADSQMALHRMLSVPFAQGLRTQINELANQLGNYNKILDAWSRFQDSWVVLASFFSSENTRQVMPSEANRFSIVRRRWMQIIQHTNENTTLFQVCSLPSLLEILIENNNYLEEICSQVLKKIDIKRVNFPRLFFLSDFDVLTIFSTADFDEMNKLLSKMFMHIIKFEHHPLDETETVLQNNFHTQNFQRIKLYGMSGEDGDTLIFTRNVILGGSIESWGPVILDVMKQSIMTHVSDSIYKYNQGDFIEWLSSVPKYISMMTMQIMFTRDIDECFDNFENNVHTFEDYIQNIDKKIQKLNDLMRTDLSIDVINKISSTIVMMSYQRDKVDMMSVRKKNFSQKDYWQTLMHMVRNQVSQQIFVEHSDNQIELGYEYWGSSKQMIQSPQSEIAMNNVITNIATNLCPVIYGQGSIGKKRLISNVASLFGNYIFFAPTFCDNDSVLFTKLFTGAVGSGAWLVMNNLDVADLNNLANITLIMQKYKRAIIENSPTFELSSNVININSSSRLLFIGSQNYFENEKIPDCLKAVLQPVAFSLPDPKKIAYVQFLSSGFLNAQMLSSQTVDFLNLFFSLIGYISHGPVGTVIELILKKAMELLHHLIQELHKSKSEDEMTNEEIYNAETLAVITSIYFNYYKLLRNVHKNLFIDLMHSHFRIFKNAYEMVSKIEKLIPLYDNNFINDVIRVIQETYRETYPIYIDYIKEFLFSLNNNLCIIIVGGPQTGKTTLQAMIADAISKMCSTPEYKEKYPDLLPYQFFDIFFRAENVDQFYGVFSMQDKTPVTKYGLLHSYFQYIEGINNCEKFIRFNGPLNQSTTRFIREMLTSGDSPRLIINTLNIYDQRSHIHFVIETDDISLLDPSIIGISRVINTRSVHVIEPISQYKGCPTFNGDIIFNRSIETTGTNLSQSALKMIHQQFNEIAPMFIKYILNIPNTIYSYSSQTFNSNAQSLIYNLLPFNGLVYALLLIEKESDQQGREFTKMILIYALFHAFISILDQANIPTFDTWAVNSFLIKIPADWVGFDVPQHFWDIFPRPSLHSLRFDGTVLKPHDFTVLNQPPIREKPINEMPIDMIDDISICTAQFLPIISVATCLLTIKQHFIIAGPQGSGKSNCIKYIFKDQTNMIPIFVPVNGSSSQQSLARFIINHTPVVSKPGSKPLGNLYYVLVFKDVRPQYIHAIEFIRSIITKKSITMFSDIDPKVLDILPLKNFIVFVTTSSLENLPERFTSLFFIQKLLPQNHHSMQYIYYKVAQELSINKLFYEPAFKVSEILSQKPNYGFNWLHTLDIFTLLSYRSAPTRNDFLECVKAFLFELKALYCHKLLTSDEMFSFNVLILNTFTDADIRMVYDPVVVGPNIYYPEIDIDEETKRLVALFSFRQVHLIREELTFLLQQFSAKINFSMKIYFFKPIIEQWIYLQRMLGYPGRNILIADPSGNGKFILTYFTASTKGFDFVHIPQRSPAEEKNPDKRRKYLTETMSDTIIKILTKNKKVCVFLRANSENDFDFKFLSSLIYEYDYNTFLPDDFRKDYYLKVTAKHPQFIDQPYQIYNHIRSELRMRLKFVIQGNSSWITNYKNFQSLYLSIESMEAIEICARDALDNPVFLKQVKELPPKTAQAIASIYINISSMCPAIQANHLFSFINTFMSFYAKELAYIEERKENLMHAIDFFGTTAKMEIELKNKFNSLTNLVKEPEEDDEEVMKSFIAKRDTIRARLTKINETEKEQKDKITALTNELNKMKQQLNNMNLKVELDRGRVNSISQQNLNEIRLIDGTKNRPLGYLMSAILAFSGQNTAFEPHGRRMINDPKFLQNILQRIKGTMFKQKTLDDSQPYIDKLATMDKELAQTHPALPILFAWIKDTYDAACLDYQVHEKENELEIQNVQLNKLLLDNQIEKESITTIASQIDTNMANHEKNMKEREDATDLYNTLKTKVEWLEQINSNSNKLIDRWMNSGSYIEEKTKQAVSASLLYATMIEYWGIFSVAQQKRSLEEILETFDTLEIPYNKEITIENLFTQLRIEDRYDKLNFDQLTPIETELGWRRMQMLQMPPLILDSDGFMYDFLVEHTKPKHLVTASLVSSNINDIITECLEKGKKLLLYDVNFLGPSLFGLLQLPKKRPEPIPFNFAGKVVQVHPKFTLYLTSSIESLNNVPHDLAARVTIQNMNTVYGKSLHRIVCAHFVKRFFPEKLPRMINIERLRMQRGVEKIMFEDDVIDSITELVKIMKGNSNDDIFEDEEGVESLIRNKECFMSSVEVKTDFSSIEKEISELEAPFSKAAKLATSMWVSISRYSSRVNKNHGFNVRKYFQMLDSALKSCKLNANPEEIFMHILHQLIAYVTPQMTLEDSYVALFIAVVMATHSEEQFSGFEEILLHINSELNNVCDMRQSEPSIGDPLEKLRFANITLVFPIIRSYLLRTLGNDFENYITNPELRLFANNDPKIPTIIKSSVTNYASSIVQMQLTQAGKSFLEIPTSMSSAYLEPVLEIAKSAISTGKVLILHYSTSPLSVSIIQSIRELIVDPNPDFRLIILATSFDELTNSLLVGSNVIFVHDFPNIRAIVYNIYNTHWDQISGSGTPVLMKKISFQLAILFALEKARNFAVPLGITSSLPITPTMVTNIFSKASKYVDSALYRDFPMENLRSVYHSDISCAVSLFKIDQAKRDANEQDIFQPRFLEQEFAFRNKKFLIQDDWDKQQYLDYVSTLDIFVDPAFLGFDSLSSQPLFNWRMSLWISKTISAMARPVSTLPSDVRTFLESMSTMIPPQIYTAQNFEPHSPMQMFLDAEIHKFNITTQIISKDIAEAIQFRTSEVFRSFSVQQVPQKWRDIVGFSGTNSIAKFFSMLFEKSKFLTSWMNGSTVPAEVDSRYIRNLNEFANAFVTEVAVQRGILRENLSYKFCFEKPQETAIGIRGIAIMCGNWDSASNMLAKSNAKTPSFMRVPMLYLATTQNMNHEPEEGYVKIPFLMRIPMQGFANVDDFETNFIGEIAAKSQIKQNDVILSGTSFICHPHDTFC